MFLSGAEHELDLDAQDHQGNTALHIAAMRGNGLMAEALCDAGVTPDGIKNNAGTWVTEGGGDASHACRLYFNACHALLYHDIAPLVWYINHLNPHCCCF